MEIKINNIEEYINDWYWDEKSHEIAYKMGEFLFDFFEYLRKSKLSEETINKHIRNCYAIGYLIISYDNTEEFTPEMFSQDSIDVLEFKHKFSDTEYAVSSYLSTCRKLKKFAGDHRVFTKKIDK